MGELPVSAYARGTVARGPGAAGGGCTVVWNRLQSEGLVPARSPALLLSQPSLVIWHMSPFYMCFKKFLLVECSGSRKETLRAPVMVQVREDEKGAG